MITREFIIENKLNKDQVAAILADNPKYDAGWVDSAANLMTDNTNGAKFNEMMLCNLSAEKLSLIEQLFKTAKQNKASTVKKEFGFRHINITCFIICLKY